MREAQSDDSPVSFVFGCTVDEQIVQPRVEQEIEEQRRLDAARSERKRQRIAQEKAAAAARAAAAETEVSDDKVATEDEDQVVVAASTNAANDKGSIEERTCTPMNVDQRTCAEAGALTVGGAVDDAEDIVDIDALPTPEAPQLLQSDAGDACAADSGNSGWQCDVCTLQNAAESKFCEACENPRPRKKSKKKKQKKMKKDKEEEKEKERVLFSDDDDDFM